MLGQECIVYMGEVDIERQSPNVFRMKMLGAEVRPVTTGSKTLKDAINEAIRDWVTNVQTTHYLIGSSVVVACLVPPDQLTRVSADGSERPGVEDKDLKAKVTGTADGDVLKLERIEFEP